MGAVVRQQHIEAQGVVKGCEHAVFQFARAAVSVDSQHGFSRGRVRGPEAGLQASAVGGSDGPFLMGTPLQISQALPAHLGAGRVVPALGQLDKARRAAHGEILQQHGQH